jgi:hypothetical protein
MGGCPRRPLLNPVCQAAGLLECAFFVHAAVADRNGSGFATALAGANGRRSPPFRLLEPHSHLRRVPPRLEACPRSTDGHSELRHLLGDLCVWVLVSASKVNRTCAAILVFFNLFAMHVTGAAWATWKLVTTVVDMCLDIGKYPPALGTSSPRSLGRSDVDCQISMSTTSGK